MPWRFRARAATARGHTVVTEFTCYININHVIPSSILHLLPLLFVLSSAGVETVRARNSSAFSLRPLAVAAWRWWPGGGGGCVWSVLRCWGVRWRRWLLPRRPRCTAAFPPLCRRSRRSLRPPVVSLQCSALHSHCIARCVQPCLLPPLPPRPLRRSWT